jgi:murein peptide amidase A
LRLGRCGELAASKRSTRVCRVAGNRVPSTPALRRQALLLDRLASLIAVIALGIGALVAAAAADAAERERTVIGQSLRGRPLVATVLGARDAATRVLVVGCVHGNETAGIRVARRLLAAAPVRDAALWVIPSLNPDGVAAGTRGNARGVDINRNFPFEWRPLRGLEYSGAHPLSEPESRAAWRLIRRMRPQVTIWFHQPFGLVDRSGGTAAIERRYAELVGLPLARLARPPGSVSSWQNHALPSGSAFVVELPPIVSASLVRRAARAVTRLASEYASADLDSRVVAVPARETSG